jgi:hypothetical protein
MKKGLFFDWVDVHRARFTINQRIKLAISIFSYPANTSLSRLNNAIVSAVLTLNFFVF